MSLYFTAQEGRETQQIAACEIVGLETDRPEELRVASDPWALRCDVERIVGEDRVPCEELERLLSRYGDSGTDAGS